MQALLDMVSRNQTDGGQGIYSICSAHPWVIEAAITQARDDQTYLLIEATANQVNQFGGYTGMLPNDFIQFVEKLADKVGYNRQGLLFGGDHLGPTCWVNDPHHLAMEKSRELIRAYVAAGFKKIHLDTSMQCVDDMDALTDEQVASRAASLCLVAEETAVEHFGHADLLYIVGTEVPPPGGATEAIEALEVTPSENVALTIETHKRAFIQQGLSEAWDRVIGIVVQPGVEFDNFSIHHYNSQKALPLKKLIQNYPGMVYEAHSTDYQAPQAYQQLVKDHFAILKVGPQLTWALREVLYALAHIEQHLMPEKKQSHLIQICEQTMKQNPRYWEKFYGADADALTLGYSYSDRIRYYWGEESVTSAVNQLISNLQHTAIPLPLISQYLPKHYDLLIEKRLNMDVTSWIIEHIRMVVRQYSNACYPSL